MIIILTVDFLGRKRTIQKIRGCVIDGFSLYSVISLFPCVFLGTMI